MGMLLYAMEMSQKNKAAGATEEKVAPKPDSAETVVSTAKPKSEYTEEKIKSMTGAQLRKLAVKNGIENPEELTAGELKAVLCEKLVK